MMARLASASSAICYSASRRNDGGRDRSCGCRRLVRGQFFVPSFRIMTVSCRPTLYIYDLPPRYRDDREGGFGAPVSLGIRSIQEYGSGVRLWQTAEFGLGELLSGVHAPIAAERATQHTLTCYLSRHSHPGSITGRPNVSLNLAT